MRASYRRAIEIIALNDEPSDTDVDSVEGSLTVQLVADLWGYDSYKVARAVVRFRLNHKER